jgi:hypothetical protein
MGERGEFWLPAARSGRRWPIIEIGSTTANSNIKLTLSAASPQPQRLCHHACHQGALLYTNDFGYSGVGFAHCRRSGQRGRHPQRQPENSDCFDSCRQPLLLQVCEGLARYHQRSVLTNLGDLALL